MTVYYNEIDPYAAQWLRNLIDAKLIAPGHVDTRSIVDVRPADLAGFEQCHFFAGLGGWSGALRLAGVSDTEPLWTGSCPCQPFSLAGKQKGFDDARHLWPVWRELIAERRPAKVYGEQVASAAQWLGLVRGDLETLGYAVGCIPIEAASSGADHLRDRFWFVGNDTRERRREGRPEHAIHERIGTAITGAGRSIDMGNSEHGGCKGRESPWVGTSSALSSGEAGLADTDGAAIWNEPGRSSGSRGSDPGEYSNDSEIRLADSDQLGTSSERQQRGGQLGGAGSDPESCDWVVGADGKARRVKSGVRLLAHGIPQRVAKLRALGNAIDLRPAATFIKATLTTG
jgi:DNA (cytosine-5)-methyltransferase 1